METLSRRAFGSLVAGLPLAGVMRDYVGLRSSEAEVAASLAYLK